MSTIINSDLYKHYKYTYMYDRYSYELRKLPPELHRKIYSYIYVDVMVHEWMFYIDLNNILHTITDPKQNGVNVMNLAELYNNYNKNDAKLFIWRHAIPIKERSMGYWYDDEHTDYYKMGNDFCKMISIEYGKLIQKKDQKNMEKLYQLLSVLMYMYKNTTKVFHRKNTVSS